MTVVTVITVVTVWQFQDLCEFVEMAAFEDATCFGPQITYDLIDIFTDSESPCPRLAEYVKIVGAKK